MDLGEGADAVSMTRLHETVGLERYKAAMLATAQVLRAPKAAPTPKLSFPERTRLPTRRIMIADIQAEVARHYQIPESEMRSPSHVRKVAWPRQVAIYLSRQLTGRSRTEIGNCFGGRDSSTIYTSCRAVEARRDADPRLDRVIRMLASRLA